MDGVKKLVNVIFATGAVGLVAKTVVTGLDPIAWIGSALVGLVLILGGHVITDAC